ncbi:phosphate acetyltransferase [Patescibacteria group bacterium]|nr:phosphate acetyltransferase [Patescibacteria group bacterium]
MNPFVRKVKNLAKKNPRHIVFPEGEEERILQATEEIVREGIAKISLVGNSLKIKNNAKKLKLDIPWKEVKIHDPSNSKLLPIFAQEFFALRKHKGINLAQAKKIVQEMNYFGTMMVHMDYADGMVTGTLKSTADSIRPALQIIKTKEKFHKVSGIFFMVLEKRLLLFADTAITIDPNSHDLVDIAVDTAETAKKFGIEPRVAMLSFSTKGSASHPEIDKVREAIAMMKYERPDIVVDGEIQVDAALVPKVAKKKCPDSPIQGDANVLIFPNLEAANIAYKLVERLAKAKAIGPLLQGLKKPVNDLSRGCNYQDIINVTAFTACECE